MPPVFRPITVLGMLMTILTGCIASPAMKAVIEPRTSEPLSHRISIVYSANYQINLGGAERLHPFDIQKYARIYEQLVGDCIVQPLQVFVPPPIEDADLLRVHTSDYLNSLRDPQQLAKYLEAPAVALLPAGIAERGVVAPFRWATGGTLLAARLAAVHGMAINIGGGYHHAEPDRGGGFCIYADLAVAIRVLVLADVDVPAQGSIRTIS